MGLRRLISCDPWVRNPSLKGSTQSLPDSAYPALYRSAESYSAGRQRAFYRVLLVQLSALLAATLTSAFSGSSWFAALLIVLELALALGCAIYIFHVRPEREWYSARAVAESVKTTAWRYMTCAEPFRDPDADKAFCERLSEILQQNVDVTKKFLAELTGNQMTDEMRDSRGRECADRLALYLDYRVREQQAWYARKAAMNDCLRIRFSAATIGAIAVCMVLAVTRVRFDMLPAWPIDILVLLAASLVTWVQSKRYSDLATSYALTAHEIGIVAAQASDVGTDEDLARFVSDAEAAFSREHTQWVARKND